MADKISAAELQVKINETRKVADELREKSSHLYHQEIEAVLKKCALDREQSLNKAKSDIEKMVKDSNDRIVDFINKSKTDYNAAAKHIADSLMKKVFGQNSEFKEEIKVSINKFNKL